MLGKSNGGKWTPPAERARSIFGELTDRELLAQHSAILDELKARKVVRSKNNPTGDYAEWLAARCLGLELAPPSAKGYDAIDAGGKRYQVKARRLTTQGKTPQLGVIRNLEGRDFDFLVAILFYQDWSIARASVIPHGIIPELSTYRSHVNGHVLRVTQTLAAWEGVRDVTALLTLPEGLPLNRV